MNEVLKRSGGELDAWWRENRPAAPEPFAEAIAHVPVTIADAPDAGTRYPHPSAGGGAQDPSASYEKSRVLR